MNKFEQGARVFLTLGFGIAGVVLIMTALIEGGIAKDWYALYPFIGAADIYLAYLLGKDIKE